MSATPRCPDCGAAIPAGQPKGLCPRCALRGALALGGTASDSLVCRRCGVAAPATESVDGFCPACLPVVMREMNRAEAGDVPTPVQAGGPAPMGLRLFDYELLEEIARGGMGVVYKARQKSLNRIVAVKMLLPGPRADAAFIQRFRIEASAAAALQHPNIVAIHEVGVHGGEHFLVMDYVDGPNLSKLAKEQPLAPKRVAQYLKVIAEAIHYAHERGILHRDLKPSNVLVDAHDQPRVTDFGLAKRLGTDSQPSPDLSQLTLSGHAIGSPSYMPPEQAAGSRSKMSRRSDVYSLGAMLYHLLTGRPPFVGGSLAETLKQVETQDPVAPRLLNSGVPLDLETICLKCLEKEPERRYHTAEELAEELNRFLNGEPVVARPIGALERVLRSAKRRPALAAVSLTATALLLIILVGLPILTLRISQHAKNETVERNRAEQMASRMEFQTAERFFGSDDATMGVAHLSRLLRREPTNRAAAERLVSALSQRWFPLPVGERFQAGAGAAFSEGNRAGVRFSSDGRKILLMFENTAHVLDAETGRPLIPPIVHGTGSNAVGSFPKTGPALNQGEDEAFMALVVSTPAFSPSLTMDFSPDGNWFLAATREVDGTYGVKAWNCSGSNATPMQNLLRHDAQALCLDFSPDGSRVVTGSANGEAKTWRVGDWSPIGEPLRHTGAVVSAWFTRDGQNVFTEAATRNSRTMFRWNTSTEKPEGIKTSDRWDKTPPEIGSRILRLRPRISYLSVGGTMNGELSFAAVRAAMSNDGKRLATSRVGQTLLWDVATSNQLGQAILYNGQTADVDFSPDGQSLVVAFWDGTARIYDASSGRPLSERMLHRDRILFARYSPDGRRLVTLSAGKTACVWNAELKPEPTVVAESLDTSSRVFGRQFSVQFSRDGRHLFTAFGELRKWDAGSGALLVKTDDPRQFTVSISPDGQALLVFASGGWSICNSDTLQPRFPMIRGGTNRQAVFSADGKEVIVCQAGGVVTRWDASNGQQLSEQFKQPPWTIKPDGLFSDLTPHGDLLILMSTGRGGVIEGWDTKTGQRANHTNFLWLPYKHNSLDGKRIVEWLDNKASVIDSKTGQPLFGPFRHAAQIACADASPDDAWLAMGSKDRTARLWNLHTSQPVAQPLEHDSGVLRIEFSPDSHRLVTVSDTAVRVWDPSTGFPLTESIRRVNCSSAHFSPNGTQLVINDHSGALPCLLDVYPAPTPVPAWLPELAEAIGGKRVDEWGVGETMFERVQLKNLNTSSAGDSGRFYLEWARWLLDDAPTRSVAFYGCQNRNERAARFLKGAQMERLPQKQILHR